MGPNLKAYFEAELAASENAWMRFDYAAAWRALERAHILSQEFAGPHVWVHVHMLHFGLRRGNMPEVLGQLLRILLAAPGSWLGRAPRGNTGGANVSAFMPMAIPDDLAQILGKHENDTV